MCPEYEDKDIQIMLKKQLMQRFLGEEVPNHTKADNGIPVWVTWC